MDELMFSMEHDEETACVVPGSVGVGLYGDGSLLGDDDLNFYPSPNDDQEFNGVSSVACASSLFGPNSDVCNRQNNPCLTTCFSDSSLLGNNENWLESATDLTELLSKPDQLPLTSPSHSLDKFSNSSASFGESDFIVKSPMEIFREIEQEAAQFSPPTPAFPPNLTTLKTMELPPAPVSVPGAATVPAQPVTVVATPFIGAPDVPKSLGNPAASIVLRSELEHLALEQANLVFSTASTASVPETPQLTLLGSVPVGFAGAPSSSAPDSAPQAVPSPGQFQPVEGDLQVVRVVGNSIVFPDGTSAVMVRNEHPPAASENIDSDLDVGSGTESVDGLLEQMDFGSIDFESTEQEVVACGPSQLAGVKKRTYQKGSYERKKMQNRQSSFRYRLKKKAEIDLKVEEYEQLAKRNKELKKSAENLQHEIDYWKKFMLELKSSE